MAGLLVPYGSWLSVHPVVIAVELYRCRCSHSYGPGSFYGDYWIFSWLWHEVGWWSILVYGAVLVAFGMFRAAFGGGDC
jgi:hypothetical protein